MGIETNINDISDLNELWPLDSDVLGTSAGHLRNIKDAAKKTFSDLSENGGIVTVTAQELNLLTGCTENIQNAINFAYGAPWTLKEPDEIPAGTDKRKYFLEKNTRVGVRIKSGRHTAEVYLPYVSEVSDGDNIHVADCDYILYPEENPKFILTTHDGEPDFMMRKPDGTWQATSHAQSNVAEAGISGDPIRWPVIRCVYFTAPAKWYVWAERGEFQDIT